MELQLDETSQDYLLKYSSVYFIFSKSNLIYIGASKCLLTRINHGRLIKDFLMFGVTSVKYFYINEKQIFEIEKQLIKLFDPICNKTVGRRKGQKGKYTKRGESKFELKLRNT